MEIKSKVLNYIKSQNLIFSGDSLICAVSGGADSVCMLDVLVSLKDELSLTLYIAHLNHGLRGAEADNDELFVKNLSNNYSLPFFSKKVNVKELSKKLKVSSEEAGRIARYEFFDELKKKLNVKKVCTAHNKNDNVETVLMRILRGTDLKGLSGISSINENDVIRPILCLSRDEIEEYLRCKGINFVTDSTNLENDFTRNKLRNLFIPDILKNYNESFLDTFSSNIELFGEANDFLDNYIDAKFNKLITKESYGAKTNTYLLLNEDKYIAKRIIKKAIFSVGNVNITNSLCNIIFDSLSKDNIITISKDFKVHIKYGNIYFVIKKAPKSFSYHLTNYGTYKISEIDSYLEISEFAGIPEFCKKNTIYIPFDKVSCNFSLRSKKNGDKMRLFKCGTKKISDILTDEKIPLFLRDDIPVLEHNGEIIWLCGVRSSSFSHKKTNGKYIKISIHKENNNA